VKKWILLIGLLTYSSVGWTEDDNTRIMKCVTESPPLGKVLLGIFKIEPFELTYSEKLLTKRERGVWKDMCKQEYDRLGCDVVGYTVIEKYKMSEYVYDFRFNMLTVFERTKEGSSLLLSEWYQCERLDEIY